MNPEDGTSRSSLSTCRNVKKTFVSQPRVRSSRQRVAARFAAAAFAVALFVVAVAAPWANAQSYSVLHTFAGYPSDGAYPFAGLIIDSSGNLYGTTLGGGSITGGTVFKLDASNSYAETVLQNFTPYSDYGFAPLYSGRLVMDPSGNLYGTTSVGGSYPNYGGGVVFKLDASNSYAETVLHTFTGGYQNDDGSEPLAGLVMDSSGNLFGTTALGGSYGNGVVFKLDASNSYAETVLNTFNNSNGAGPWGLIFDPSGNLYGTTQGGGSYGQGVAFKLDASNSYAETVLHNFGNFRDADGSSPRDASLVMDSSGNLYGTTSAGGPFNYGTAFKLDASNSYAETVLYNFTGGGDGGIPFADLILGPSGNLYGTTYGGGSFGVGVVFKLDASNSYAETVLHNFTGGADGSTPFAGLVMDSSGNLYGTARWGGTGTCNDRGTLGCGTVFKIADLKASVQQPINPDGTSVFNAHRGVVVVKFTLTLNGVATCQLPPATISLTRTSGGTIGPVDESVYETAADTGSNFRISNCQYVYNLAASSLGVGTYRVDISINGGVVGSGIFGLQ